MLVGFSRPFLRGRSLRMRKSSKKDDVSKIVYIQGIHIFFQVNKNEKIQKDKLQWQLQTERFKLGHILKEVEAQRFFCGVSAEEGRSDQEKSVWG